MLMPPAKNRLDGIVFQVQCSVKRLVLLSLFVFMLTPTAIAQETNESRPNILFLFADDMTFEALGSLHLQDVETPNLDRLAARGTTFTHAYNMGSWSGAVCIASRTMLITGRYVWEAEAIHPQTTAEREAGRLWPQLLASAGYDTYMTGKWHINTDAKACFQVTRHVRPGMPATVESSYDRPHQDRPEVWSSSDPSLGGFWEEGKHWTEVGADDAISFLDLAREDSDPFFMYIAFNSPHDPRQAPQEFLDRYPLDRIKLPENFLVDYPHAQAMGCGPGLRDEKLAPFPRTPFSIQTHRREYFACITHLDQQIGRILDHLDATGLADNTLVVFTADHGLAAGRHGLMGKQNMYDHSVRVPFVIAGPGVPSDNKIDAAIYLQDVVPTTLESAAISTPEHMDFHSLWPLLRADTSESAYSAVYGGYLKLQRSVTVGDWKLIVYPTAKVVRLFNLADDPMEMNDLAESTEHRENVQQLLERLVKLQQELSDTVDLSEIVREWE